MTPNIFAPLAAVADALDRLHVRYHIGGSVASTVYGVRRSTADVDLITDLRPEHVAAFVELLGADFYVDADAVQEAITLQRSFNLIHYATAMKIDVFILQPHPFHQSEMDRAAQKTLVEGGRSFPVKSAEDIVLRKLLWFKEGGEVSERQWRDVVGVLKLQAPRLDREYLQRWAAELGIVDLLGRASGEAGV